MNIRAVIFDLDNVVYDEASYFEAVFYAAAPDVANALGGTEEDVYPAMIEMLRERGTSRSGLFADILHRLDAYSAELDDALFELYCTLDVPLRPYPDALEMLSWLKSNKYLTGLITNGTVAAQRNKIRRLGVGPFFDSVVLARELGRKYEKPHVAPYRKVLKDLRIRANAALYIGDNPHVDFPGAVKLGIHPVRLNRGEFRDRLIGADGSEHTIEDLTELKDILKEGARCEAVH